MVATKDANLSTELPGKKGSSVSPITVSSTPANSDPGSASPPPHRGAESANSTSAPVPRQPLRFALSDEELMVSEVESVTDEELRASRGPALRKSVDADGQDRNDGDDINNSVFSMHGEGSAYHEAKGDAPVRLSRELRFTRPSVTRPSVTRPSVTRPSHNAREFRFTRPSITRYTHADLSAARVQNQEDEPEDVVEQRVAQIDGGGGLDQADLDDADQTLPARVSVSPALDIAVPLRASTAELPIPTQSTYALPFEPEVISDGDESSSSGYRARRTSVARANSLDEIALTQAAPAYSLAKRCGSAISDEVDIFDTIMDDFDDEVDLGEEDFPVDGFLDGQAPVSSAAYIDTEDYSEPLLGVDEQDHIVGQQDQIMDEQEDDPDSDEHGGDADQSPQTEDAGTESDTVDGQLPSRSSSQVFTSDAVEAEEAVSPSSHSSVEIEQLSEKEITGGDGETRSASPASCKLDASVTSDSSVQTITTAHIGIQASSDKAEKGVQVDQPDLEINAHPSSETGRKRKLADLGDADDDTVEQVALQTGSTQISLPVSALCKTEPAPPKRRRVSRSVLSYAGTLAAGMGIGAGALLYTLNIPDEME